VSVEPCLSRCRTSLQHVTSQGTGGRTHHRSRSSSENKTTEVGSALVAQSASRINESADAIGLEAGADKGGTPGGSGTAGLLGADELLLGVGGLGALVGLSEDGGQYGELDALIEGEADGDGRGLDRGKICACSCLVSSL
jgi:hypothetical protein